MFEHGAYIEGYGKITGMYHTKDCTVYICFDGGKYNYYRRAF